MLIAPSNTSEFLPGLSPQASERLFSEFQYPRPDPASLWNRYDMVYSNGEIMRALHRLSSEVQGWVSERTATSERPPLMVGLLNGCAPLYLWILDTLTEPRPDACAIKVSTYDTANAAKTPLLVGALPDVKDRHVLLIDDMGDTFRTERYMKQLLRDQGAISVDSCVLLKRTQPPDYDGPQFSGLHVAREKPTFVGEFFIGGGLNAHGEPTSRVACDEDAHAVFRIAPKMRPLWLPPENSNQ